MLKADELAKKICDGSWEEGDGRDFYMRFFGEIAEVGTITFLVAYLKNSDMREVRSLMLSMPELWKNFTIDDWLKVMKEVGDRPPYAKKGQIGEVGVHADLMLLCKYLEIDGLDLYLNHAQATEKNKLNTLTYLNGFLREFVKDDSDYEDLSAGEENVFDGLTLADLDQIKQNLLADPRVKEFPHDEAAARAYVEEVYQSYKQAMQTV